MMINSTLQAALLASLSNLMAQVIQAYRGGRPLSLEYGALVQFVVFSLISTPPNILWQEYLEERFPANHWDETGNKKLHKGNTTAKLVLDQTLGAIFNSYLFIAGIGALKGKDVATILSDCQRVR
jgi:protein Mpv17